MFTDLLQLQVTAKPKDVSFALISLLTIVNSWTSLSTTVTSEVIQVFWRTRDPDRQNMVVRQETIELLNSVLNAPQLICSPQYHLCIPRTIRRHVVVEYVDEGSQIFDRTAPAEGEV